MNTNSYWNVGKVGTFSLALALGVVVGQGLLLVLLVHHLKGSNSPPLETSLVSFLFEVMHFGPLKPLLMSLVLLEL
jgi:hypothetical protein